MEKIRGLDAYITGQNIHLGDLVRHACPKCKAIKNVPMFYELGAWFYASEGENEAYCEPCGMNMEAKEG